MFIFRGSNFCPVLCRLALCRASAAMNICRSNASEEAATIRPGSSAPLGNSRLVPALSRSIAASANIGSESSRNPFGGSPIQIHGRR